MFFKFSSRRLVRKLAIEVEELACKLASAPVVSPQPKRVDVVRALQTTRDLLTNLLVQQEEAALPVDALTQPQDETGGTADPDKTIEASPSPQPSHTKEMEYIVLPEPLLNAHPELSATARSLIGLSDWILLTNAGGTSVSPEAVSEIYRQLVHVLAKEGVTLLQNDGPCDYDRQRVVGTRHTDDPVMVDCVCSTIRPGYLFREQLLRPQEVIVYVE